MATTNVAEDYPVRMVGLRALSIDHEVQSRCTMDLAHSRGITDFVLKHGPIPDPVIVFDDGDKLWLADGFHRHYGYLQAARVDKRFNQIRCEIRPGTRIDAIVYSAGANQETHTKLKRTAEDIKRAYFILFALPEWWEATDIGLANHVGTSPQLAQRHRLAYADETGTPLPEKVVTSNLRRRSRRAWALGSTDVEAPIVAEKRARPGRPPRSQYRVTIRGKRIYLGGDPEAARSSAAALLEESRRRRSLLNEDSISSFLLRRDLLLERAGTHQSKYPGMFGMHGRGVVLTWQDFAVDPSACVQSIGRVLLLRRHIEPSARAVVLCVPEDGPAEILDLGRQLGVEFLTPDDFVASLAPEGGPA